MRGRSVTVGFIFVIGIVLLSAVETRAPLAWSQEPFPNKPITWIVPYAPGGGFDLHSRAVAPVFRKYLGVPVIVKNIPGAGGVIGWNTLWISPPDGHTVGIVNLPGAVVSELFGKPKPKYRLREFSWIGRISAAPYMWAAGANTPYRSLQDMQRSKEVLVSEVGVGGTAWVVAALTSEVMGFKARQILGYPGAPAAIAAIVRGEGEARAIGMDSPGQMQFIRDGKMIPLFVYSDKRDPDFANVPSVAELGYPELAVLASHRVVAAPSGVPEERLKVLRDAFAKAIADPEALDRFKKMKAEPTPLVGEEFKPVLNGFFELMRRYSKIFTAALQ